MTTLPLQFLLLPLCMLAEAFFSGMETGVISVNRLRLLHRARSGSRGARIIEDFLREPERLLGTTLTGTNLCTVIVSTLAANVSERWGVWGQSIAGVGVALTLLVVGEFLPKAWFNSRPLERCIPLAGTLRVAERILKPISVLIMALTRWAAPAGRRGNRSPFVTREHLQILTQDSEAGGQISTFERLMIQRVLDLQLQTAAEIMTPLARVASLKPDTPLIEAVELVRRHGHLRLPVLDPASGECLGLLHMQDVLAQAGDLERETAAQRMQPPFFLADSLRADDVLPVLRRHRQPIAIVRDANNRPCGIVTVENVLKLLVGDIPASASSARKGDRERVRVAPPPPPAAPV